jgi:hypothetical protein
MGGLDGFTAGTGWLTTKEGDGVTPWGRFSDPFPGGPALPVNTILGSLTNLGSGIGDPLRNVITPPYMQTWSAGFQHKLPGNWLVDANYIGTKGTHLYFYGAGEMNHFGTWIEKEATDPDLRAALWTYVPNPYYGIITTPGSSMAGPTIPAEQLLLPFPQFTNVWGIFPPWANSIYHAFQLKLEKRFSNGLAMLITYTNSKSIDDASLSSNTGWLGGFAEVRDPNNLKLERSLSEWDIPQVLQISYLYQLPFGRGKRWGTHWNPVLNAFLGGWQTNGIWRLDNGQPIHIDVTGTTPPDTYTFLGESPNLTGQLYVNPKSKWFTDGYFANANDVLAVPANWTVGNAPRMLPNVRLPGTKTAALSLFKEISLNKIREGSRLEFRVESFNALNHPQFGNIATIFGTDNFGNVQSQVNTPREVQMALKVYW